MTKSFLSDREKRKLVSLLEEVLPQEDHVSALIAVCKKNNLTPEQVKLLIWAYNNGKVVGHILESEDLEEKAASFPIIKTEDIFAALFPKDFKDNKVVSKDYCLSGKKVASILEEKPKRKQKKVASVVTKQQVEKKEKLPREVERYFVKKALDKEVSRLRGESLLAQKEYLDNFMSLRNYFCRVDSCSAETISKEAEVLYGEPAVLLIKKASRNLKRKHDAPLKSVETNKPPFIFIENALKAVKKYGEAEGELKKVSKPPKPQKPKQQIKQANGSMIGAATLGSLLSTAIKRPVESYFESKPNIEKTYRESAFGKATQDISDEGMIYSLLVDDPILSNYPIEKVETAYNYLRDFAPLASRKISIVQQFLRKLLEQGTLDTFSLEQLSKIEERLAKSESAGEDE